MVSIVFVFALFVFMFAMIGTMRGWAKELLVSFSVILALAILTTLTTYVPPVQAFLENASPKTRFWFRVLLLGVMVFFGYQTPRIPRVPQAKFARAFVQDTLLGFFLGALNGYLIVGTVWYYLHQIDYPFKYIVAPVPGDVTMGGDLALTMLHWMPPNFLGIPGIYFAVLTAFFFVLAVFL